MKSEIAQFANQFDSLVVGDVNEDQVLGDRGAERTAAEALGQVCCGLKLFARQSAAAVRGAPLTAAGLTKRMAAEMLAKLAVRKRLR